MPRQPLSLKGRALKYLSMREHSRAELAQKLAAHAGPEDNVPALLDGLEEAGWLSAERFVASVIHRKASRYGTVRLQAELARHHLPQALTQEATQALRHSELARAQALWAKRYGQAAATPAEQAKQARFLAGRGFASDIIWHVVKHPFDIAE